MNDILRKEIIKSMHECVNTLNDENWKPIPEKLQEFILSDNPKDKSAVYRLSKSDVNYKLHSFGLSDTIYQYASAVLLTVKTVRGVYIYPYHAYYDMKAQQYDLFDGYRIFHADDKYFIEKGHKLINMFGKDFEPLQDIENSYLTNDFLLLSDEEQEHLISAVKAKAVLLAISEKEIMSL